MRCLIVLLLGIGLAMPATAQNFEKGKEAYDSSDYETALWEWRPLAERGDADAQLKLGNTYVAGHTEPVNWYRRAAEQGLAEARSSLGYMYHTGRGVAQDYVQAHLWHNLAVLRMPPGETRDIAVRNRDRAEKRMTPAQVAEAQRLAREWKPKVEAEN